MRLEAEEDALSAVHISSGATHLATVSEHAVLRRAVAWLDRYFAGLPVTAAELPLKFTGTPFQRMVWEQLLAVPYGHFTTYGELAAVCARLRRIPRMSAQAVGGAVGANPLPLFVPCHRVLAAGGRLGGFSCGLAVKRFLLDLEGISFRE